MENLAQTGKTFKICIIVLAQVCVLTLDNINHATLEEHKKVIRLEENIFD